MPSGKMYLAARAANEIVKQSKRRRKPRVTRPVKKYIDKQIKKSSWSKQMYSTIDFDVSGLSDSQSAYTLSKQIVLALSDNNAEIMRLGKLVRNTDGSASFTKKIRIDYIKWQFRYQLGESEELSGIDQTYREIFFRARDQYEDIEDPANIPNLIDDIDGNIKYGTVQGMKSGVYSDRIFRAASHAADSNTTVRGQYISKGFRKLKYVDIFTCDDNGESFTSKNGQLALVIRADDPVGTNGDLFGYVEIGWRYQNDG